MDIYFDCVHCDKNGNKQFKMALTDVCHLEGSNLNLCIISRTLKQGWNMAAKKESIVMNKGSLKMCFDIIIPTKQTAKPSPPGIRPKARVIPSSKSSAIRDRSRITPISTNNGTAIRV